MILACSPDTHLSRHSEHLDDAGNDDVDHDNGDDDDGGDNVDLDNGDNAIFSQFLSTHSVY